MTGKRIRVDINEIRQPELEATLVAQSIADQIQRQVSFRRATRQAVQRSMQAGAQGIRVAVSGRLGGAEIARREKAMDGRVPLHTLRADIDFGTAEAHTQMGRIGVKVWVYRGDQITEATPEELARRSALLSAPVTAAADGAPSTTPAAAASEPTPPPPAQAEPTAPPPAQAEPAAPPPAQAEPTTPPPAAAEPTAPEAAPTQAETPVAEEAQESGNEPSSESTTATESE